MLRSRLFDAANPTGYAQAVEEFEVVAAAPSSWVRTRSTVVGLDVLSTSTPRFAYPVVSGEPVPQPDAPLVMVYDAGGSVRDVLANHEAAGDLFTFAADADGATGGTPGAYNPDLPQRADYDAFGELILFAPAGQSTPSVRRSQRDAAITALEQALLSHLTYRGEQYDTHLRMQYLRARHYDQGTGRFTRLDPLAGVPGEPLTFHRYAYAHANPMLNIDPTGTTAMNVNDPHIAIAESVSIAMRGAATAFKAAALSKAALYAVGSVTVLTGAYLIYALAVNQSLRASGQTRATEDYVDFAIQNVGRIARATAQVIRRAAREHGRQETQKRGMPVFVLPQILLPEIYAHKERALLANPSWLLLNYMRDPGQADKNRREATVQYYRGPAAGPGQSLDEFPFASTREGGGQHSSVEPVPAWQNFAEGGMLTVFYRFMMKSKAGPFLVVLLPTVGD